MKEDRILRIYTDGGCAGNQSDENLGGWGAILDFGQAVKELYGSEKNTTNNRMEMTASAGGSSCCKKGKSGDPRVFRQQLPHGLLSEKMVCFLAKKRMEDCR